MSEDTLRINPLLQIPDKERVLDWLTALTPMLIMSLVYYWMDAAALYVTAIGGYLMASVLMARLAAVNLAQLRLSPALFCGFLSAFCLPVGSPWWISALMGGVAAVVVMTPLCARRVHATSWLAQPLVQPPLVALVLIRLLFPAAFSLYQMPEQFAALDTTGLAAPFAAWGETAPPTDWWRLWFGAYGGAIGQTCVAAVLLAGAYLLIRRRLRLIAPACMLAVIAALSWMLWGEAWYALYALFIGGVVFAALLLADKTYAPKAPLDQAIVGCVAGAVTVLLWQRTSWTEGAALGVLVAELLTPCLPFLYTVFGITWAWIKPYLVRFFRFAWAKIQVGARWLWRMICRGAQAVLTYAKKLLQKTENNG